MHEVYIAGFAMLAAGIGAILYALSGFLIATVVNRSAECSDRFGDR